jgi:prevent-host-death family protein
MNDDDSRMNVRDVRAHLAEVLTRAQNGSPTVIMRNGEPVAAVVPIEDFNVLEDAIDRYFSREADRDLAEDPEARTYSMAEAVAAIFGEDTGQGAT